MRTLHSHGERLLRAHVHDVYNAVGPDALAYAVDAKAEAVGHLQPQALLVREAQGLPQP